MVKERVGSEGKETPPGNRKSLPSYRSEAGWGRGSLTNRPIQIKPCQGRELFKGLILAQDLSLRVVLFVLGGQEFGKKDFVPQPPLSWWPAPSRSRAA